MCCKLQNPLPTLLKFLIANIEPPPQTIHNWKVRKSLRVSISFTGRSRPSNPGKRRRRRCCQTRYYVHLEFVPLRRYFRFFCNAKAFSRIGECLGFEMPVTIICDRCSSVVTIANICSIFNYSVKRKVLKLLFLHAHFQWNSMLFLAQWRGKNFTTFNRM